MRSKIRYKEASIILFFAATIIVLVIIFTNFSPYTAVVAVPNKNKNCQLVYDTIDFDATTS